MSEPEKKPGRFDELTPLQQRFVEEYLVDLNAGAAAERAGYSPKSKGVLGYQLLQNPKISRAIDEKKGERSYRTAIDADVVLIELLSLARADIGEAFDEDGNLKPLRQMPEEVRRAISGVEVDEIFEGRGPSKSRIGYLKKVRFWDKTRALELLGKHVGLIADRVKIEDADGVLAKLLGVSKDSLPPPC